MRIHMGNARKIVHHKHVVGTVFKSWLSRIVTAAIMVFVLSQIPLSVSANPGLTVTNAAIVDIVSLGQVLTQTMTVSINDTDPATDLTVSVTGVAQTASGAFILLDPAQDTNPDTARPWVTVEPSSFHLDPGQSQDITATITVPQNVNASYFAMIKIANPPSVTPGSNVAIVTSVSVPVYLTIKNSQITEHGQITGITTGDITNGQPLDITTTFQNTGNTYFKVEGETTITNSQGVMLDDVPIPLTSGSIIPGMSRNLEAIYTPSGSLAPGTYTISSKVMLSDSTVLDQSTSTFTIKAPYVPPPALGTVSLAPSGASTLTSTDGTIIIYFPKGAAAVPVTISVNNIAASQLPTSPTGFTLTGNALNVGGLTGLLAKNATVTIRYTADDLSKAGGNASKLRLLRWDPGTNQWVILKTNVDTKAATLSATSKQMGIWAVAVGTATASSHINWIIIGVIVVVVLVIIGLITIYILSNRKTKA